MKNKACLVLILLCFCGIAFSQAIVPINNPETWKTSDISSYVGQTVRFTNPFFVCNNYYNFSQSSLTISPRRLFWPTNQVLPGGSDYSALKTANSNGSVTLTGVTEYHRMGERLVDLVVEVTSANTWKLVSCTFAGNTRNDLLANVPNVNMKGEYSLLVCAMNLEYYIVESFDPQYGPANEAAHQKQRTKIKKALAKINADLYGFVEIQQGQGALAEIAEDLSKETGRPYTYINDGGKVSGTYTKSGYVYCTDVLSPRGPLLNNNAGNSYYRKKMQVFEEKSSGEAFIFSLNHFKSKSDQQKKASGDDADQNDGQGKFNATRLAEAKSVLSQYNSNKASIFKDPDILIMGDLNAYAKEDPIRHLIGKDMTDLHRYFHADSSYSYVYHGEAGYLDHALCNSTMLPQITGVQPYHINSDEDTTHTYKGPNADETMFSSSDHDPILVGLKLAPGYTALDNCHVTVQDGKPVLYGAEGGFFQLYNINGKVVTQGTISSSQEVLPITLPRGFYIFCVSVGNEIQPLKIIVH